VFHGFGQDKFAKSGSILGSSHIATVRAASKNDTQFKSGQNRPTDRAIEQHQKFSLCIKQL